MIADLEKTWTSYATYVNQYLSDYLDRLVIRSPATKKLWEAMAYSCLGAGKRFRPVLALATCDLLGKPVQYMVPFAGALELIHCYSLVHDDLPCMDNDEIRRGKPTTHKAYGEDIALLVGDSLLTEAFHMVTLSKAAPESILKSIQILSKAAGFDGMVSGQMDDIHSGGDLALSQLIAIHKNKTGALISASVTGMAALCGTNDESQLALVRYSENLGLAFQVKDDLLDAESGEKVNFVRFMGRPETENYLKSLTQNCLKNLELFGKRAHFLTEIALYNQQREA